MMKPDSRFRSHDALDAIAWLGTGARIPAAPCLRERSKPVAGNVSSTLPRVGMDWFALRTWEDDGGQSGALEKWFA
jgi:hypothetical protein